MATKNLYVDACDGYYAGQGSARYSQISGSFHSSGGYQNRPYFQGFFAGPIPAPTNTIIAGMRYLSSGVGLQAVIFFGGPSGFNLTDLIARCGFTNLGIPTIELGGSAGTTYGSGDFTIFPDTYYYLVFRATIIYDGIANVTHLTADFFIDGVQRVTASFDVSGLFQNGLAYGAEMITSTFGTAKMQDVYMSGESSIYGGAGSVTWPDVVVVSDAPTGDGALLQWAPTPAGTHFSILAAVPTDLTKFIGDTGVGTQDDHTYGLTPPTPNAGILAAQITSLQENTTGGLNQMRHEYRVAGINSDGNQFQIPSTNVYLDSAWLTNPSTGVAWVAADLISPNEWGELRVT